MYLVNHIFKEMDYLLHIREYMDMVEIPHGIKYNKSFHQNMKIEI